MSDIKKEIYKSESEHLAISLYRIDTLHQLINSLQEEKENFITTIESQKEEIEQLKLSLKRIIFQEDEPVLQEGDK